MSNNTWNNYALLQTISEYFPAYDRHLNCGVNTFLLWSELRMHWDEPSTWMTLGTSAITHDATLWERRARFQRSKDLKCEEQFYTEKCLWNDVWKEQNLGLLALRNKCKYKDRKASGLRLKIVFLTIITVMMFSLSL